jgi:hypothetical protein
VSRVPQRVSEKKVRLAPCDKARDLKTNTGAIIVFAALTRATRRDPFLMLIGFEPDGLPAGESAWRVAMPHDRPAIYGSAREALMNLEKDRSFLKAARVFDDDFIDSHIELNTQEVIRFETTRIRSNTSRIRYVLFVATDGAVRRPITCREWQNMGPGGPHFQVPNLSTKMPGPRALNDSRRCKPAEKSTLGS